MRERASKTALRDRIVAARHGLDATALAEHAHALASVLLSTPTVATARTVAAYVGVGREPGTAPLLAGLERRGVEVLLPVLPKGPEQEPLDWARYTGPDGLVSSRFGLLEPAAPPLGPSAVHRADVVLLPGLAVDTHGMRLGRGGGFYDRVLAQVSVWTCVLLFDDEVLPSGSVPAEPHDVRVDAAATPAGLVLLPPRG